MKHTKLLVLALLALLVAVTACDSTSPTPAQALPTATSQPEATPLNQQRRQSLPRQAPRNLWPLW